MFGGLSPQDDDLDRMFRSRNELVHRTVTRNRLADPPEAVQDVFDDFLNHGYLAVGGFGDAAG